MNAQAAVQRVLVLAGTGPARELCEALARDAGIDARASLAGRTRAPRPLALATRHGGFGGAHGLAEWLRSERINALIDATHPFATRISDNAALACMRTRTPRARLLRPAWQARSGDHWQSVASLADAARQLPRLGRCALLALGHQHLAAFAGVSGMNFVVRSVEPAPADLPLPNCSWVAARGPFRLDEEITLFRDAGIDVLVCRNSGGPDSYAKLEAARALGLPVLMLERPVNATHTQAAPGFEHIERVLAWLKEAHDSALTSKTAQPE